MPGVFRDKLAPLAAGLFFALFSGAFWAVFGDSFAFKRAIFSAKLGVKYPNLKI